MLITSETPGAVLCMDDNYRTETQLGNLTRWIEWLRITDLPQGQGMLHRTVSGSAPDSPLQQEGFCCMGLYAELSGVPSRLSDGMDGRTYIFPRPTENTPHLTSTSLSMPNEHWFYDEVGLGPPEAETLATLNDGERKTFAEIADYIEATFTAKPDPIAVALEEWKRTHYAPLADQIAVEMIKGVNALVVKDHDDSLNN